MSTNTPSYSTNLVIPQNSSVVDPVANQELTYTFNALRALAISIDENTGALSVPQDQWPVTPANVSVVGGNGYKFYAVASSLISFGQFVTFANDGAGNVTAAPANASSYTTAAYGFCLLTAGVASGDYGEFIIGPGINYGISGMTPGLPYFLSDTVPGAISTGPGTTTGHIYQCLGVALTPQILSVGAFNNWRVI